MILLVLTVLSQIYMVAYADEGSGLKGVLRQIVTAVSKSESQTETDEASQKATPTDAKKETETKKLTKKATPTEAQEPVKKATPTEAQEPVEKATPTEVQEEQVFTYKKSGLLVKVYPSSPIDEDATLSVEELDADSFDNETFAAWAADQMVYGASIYDIYLIDADGNRIETEEADVKIELSDTAVPEAEEAETKLVFLHVTDDGTIEEGEVQEDGTFAEITASGFSPFIFVRISSSDNTVLPAVEETTFEVSSADELKNAIEAVNSGEGSYTISILCDIDATSAINITKNTVTIIGNGHTLDFGNLDHAISVNGDSGDSPVLILGKDGDGSNTLTIKSNGADRGDGKSFIRVGNSSGISGNGTLEMFDGVTVRDAWTNNYFGGGILVGGGGKFEMNGGTITNCGITSGSVCHGGGVAVICGGEFVMNGGTISHCSVKETGYDNWAYAYATGGGVYVGLGSTFIMNDGTIENNYAASNGGGVMIIASQDSYYDRGVGFLDSRFEMHGGTIQNNKAELVGGGLAAMGTFSKADALATATPESGAPSNPGVYISGGSLSNNKAMYGGGIVFYQIRSSIPMQIHGAVIENNKAEFGGGICVFGYWTNTDIDGCTIKDNTASEKGAGICMTTNGAGGNTTLKNSTITGNKSSSIGAGAGVYYDGNSKLTISGSNTIQNNYYVGSENVSKINNLNIYDKDHPVYINGSLQGSSIGLSDPTLWNDNLNDSDDLAVSTIRLTDGFKANNADIDPDAVFTSDHSTWTPYYGEKKEDTTRTDYDTTPVTWSGVKAKNTVWVVPDIEIYGSSTQKTLYYNRNSKTYSIDQSSYNSPVVMIYKDDTYYLAYKYGNEYYILKSLSGQPQNKTYSLGGRNMTFGHFTSDLSIDGYNYLRFNNFTDTDRQVNIDCYEQTQISNNDGYDYTNEVRLIRGYAIRYYDGDNEANFGSIEHPTIYRNSKVKLVNPAEKTGYEFKGWYRDASLTDGPVTELGENEAPDSGNRIVLYGKWERILEEIVVGDLENVVYNGKEQKQIPVVKTTAGKVLTSSDYTISYSEDTKNAGKVTVTITGIGNYTGTVKKTYEIIKKELVVKTESATKYYDGKPLTAGGSIDGFVEGENAELHVTGSQTSVGTSNNSYTIVWNDIAKESNYEIQENVGSLTVQPQNNDSKDDKKDDSKGDSHDSSKGDSHDSSKGDKRDNSNNKSESTPDSGNRDISGDKDKAALESESDNLNTAVEGSSRNRNNGNSDIPNTGDDSNIALWIALLIISCGSVTAILVTGKRKS